jgi:hypothetical protein
MRSSETSTLSEEIAQARRHQPHQAVEHDFEHRKAFIRHHRGVDDGANAGILVEIDFAVAEAEEIVDFLLRQHTLAAGLADVEERPPSSTIAAHCSAMVSSAYWLRFGGGGRIFGSSAPSHSAASAS